MSNLAAWIKANKLLTLLLLLVGYLLYKQFQYSIPFLARLSEPAYDSYGYGSPISYVGNEAAYYDSKMISPMPPIGSVDMGIDLSSRMVVTYSYFSVVVEDVAGSISSIKSMAEGLGGFMVSSSLNTPEGLTSGDIAVRVPLDKLGDLESHLRGLSIKVVSESTSGSDVTDQYFDIEERLATLETTKAKYEQILNSATNVEEILAVTQALVQIQDQIDNLKGDAEYLTDTSETALVTVYLSTDEFQLPYAPEQPWRPDVVFKTAVRSLIELTQTIGDVIIYAVVFAPAILVGWAIYKVLTKKSRKSK